MASTSNPVLRNIVKKNASQGGAGAHGFNAFGAQYSSFGFPDAAQSQAYSMGGYSQGADRLGSQSYAPAGAPVYSDVKTITYDDIVAKTAICLGLVFLAAVAEIALFNRAPQLGMVLGAIGSIAGLVLVFVRAFKRSGSTKPYALGYAVAQGLAVGLLVAVLQMKAHAGLIAGQAFLGTIGVFAAMLFMYKNRILRATPRFNKILFTALIGVVVASLGSLVYGVITGNDPLNDGGPFAIGFSLVCIVIASLSLITDFETARTLVEVGADKEEAWSAALGLTITLVWLYVEILRILSYFSGSDD